MTPWTTTEARIARERRAAGDVVSQIAPLLGRSEHSVYAFLRYNHEPVFKREAIKVRCPNCGAKAGDPCFASQNGHKGRRRKTFHRERLVG